MSLILEISSRITEQPTMMPFLQHMEVIEVVAVGL